MTPTKCQQEECGGRLLAKPMWNGTATRYECEKCGQVNRWHWCKEANELILAAALEGKSDAPQEES